MQDIDERLRAGLERLAEPPDPSSAFERVVARKARRRWLRRLGTAALVVTVLAGTATGTYALARVFGVGATKRPPAGGSNLPTNGKIAFVRVFETADSWSSVAVHVMEPDGTGLERVSSELPAAADLSWSPDGTRLAMAAAQGSSPNDYMQIYVLNADGSDLTQLTHDPSSEDIDPAWSPDGEKIVFAKWSDDGTSSGLYITGVDGNGQTRLTDSASLDSSPAWFPDGSGILFKRDTMGVTQLFLVNADGTGKRALEAPSGGYIGSLELSPDGRKLVFTRLDPSFGQKNFDIFLANTDGTGEARLTETAVPEGAPTWSPDGTRIAFVRAGDIYTMAADGSDVRRLTDSGSDGWPAWQALPSSTGTLVPSPQPTPSAAR
ncbi:MAG TPA: DPP IV N-terminal domain-containing protein [Actinomycetota bacterium]|nr:DPP IV N-terminal domain-containing protein [Actinomycetota bacterium]